MKILITGDFVINKNYTSKQVSKEVVDLFTQSDYNIVNLEAPVTESNSRILKTGPHLKSDKKSTQELLKTLQIDLCTLANNHVLDYDEQGVIDTINFCKANNIQTVGAGKNLIEASKVFYKQFPDFKIAIINVAENEWSSASNTSAGSNGMDLIENTKQIQKAKKECDLVFVIVHGGHEYYNLPSPRMQKQYRFYIDNGADLVVGHHTHCISGMEIYKNKPIYYSLGNFLFTNVSNYDDWYLGLILEINIEKSILKTKVIPVIQERNEFDLKLPDSHKSKNILKRFYDYNSIINDDDLLKENWENYIIKESELYLMRWSPVSFIKNKYIRALINKLGIKISSNKGLILLLNLIRCEAHSDLSKDVIKKYIYRNNS